MLKFSVANMLLRSWDDKQIGGAITRAVRAAPDMSLLPFWLRGEFGNHRDAMRSGGQKEDPTGVEAPSPRSMRSRQSTDRGIPYLASVSGIPSCTRNKLPLHCKVVMASADYPGAGADSCR